MEDSRKGRRNGEKGQKTPSPHVDEEKCKESIVYKMKEGERNGDWKNIPEKSSGECPRTMVTSELLSEASGKLISHLEQRLGQTLQQSEGENIK